MLVDSVNLCMCYRHLFLFCVIKQSVYSVCAKSSLRRNDRADTGSKDGKTPAW